MQAAQLALSQSVSGIREGMIVNIFFLQPR